jgi:8-oxo-dGTP pyrophosphatase MutT (NUDIX family)
MYSRRGNTRILPLATNRIAGVLPLVWQNVLRHWTDRLVLRAGGPGAAKQAGAIPYTVVQGQVVFLLVTSRGSGRWIFPKGEPIVGLQPWEVAAQEALEEAGVEGEIDPHPLGFYRTFKSLAFRRKIVEVEMYPLRVTRQLDDWPEKKYRHRHWAILPEVKRLLSDAQLAELAAKLSQLVRAQPQPAIERISK